MVTEKTRELLEKAVVIAVAIAYQGPEDLRKAVEEATLAEAMRRWEEPANEDLRKAIEAAALAEAVSDATLY